GGAGDRDRGRVRGEDRVVGRDRVELTEDAGLDPLVLDDRLDDHVTGAAGAEVGGPGHASYQTLALGRVDLPTPHGALDGGGQRGLGALQWRSLRLVEDDVDPRSRARLRDP